MINNNLLAYCIDAQRFDNCRVLVIPSLKLGKRGLEKVQVKFMKYIFYERCYLSSAIEHETFDKSLQTTVRSSFYR